MLALGRKIVNGEEGDLSADEAGEETVEAVFAQTRDAEAVAEELLVDEGWRTLEVEPEIVEASASADNGTNGTGVALDIGAINDHAEVEEPEQSVLTWAELFAEGAAEAKRTAQAAAIGLTVAVRVGGQRRGGEGGRAGRRGPLTRC